MRSKAIDTHATHKPCEKVGRVWNAPSYPLIKTQTHKHRVAGNGYLLQIRSCTRARQGINAARQAAIGEELENRSALRWMFAVGFHRQILPGSEDSRFMVFHLKDKLPLLL